MVTVWQPDTYCSHTLTTFAYITFFNFSMLYMHETVERSKPTCWPHEKFEKEIVVEGVGGGGFHPWRKIEQSPALCTEASTEYQACYSYAKVVRCSVQDCLLSLVYLYRIYSV